MARARSIGGLLALAILAIAGLVLFGGGAAAGPGGDPGAGAQDSDSRASAGISTSSAAQAGLLLYLQSCASCHGPNGQGTALGPSLSDTGPADFDFFMRTGRMPLSAPGQPDYRQGQHLTASEVAALVGFGATIGSATPAIPDVVVDASALAAGRELFINNCAACHGATGTGGSIGGGAVAPSLIGTDPTTVGEAVLIGPGVMPHFGWTDQQLSQVASYIQFLGHAPAPGGITLGGYGPVPEGFIAVVLGLGVLVVISRWIAHSPREASSERTEATAGTAADSGGAPGE